MSHDACVSKNSRWIFGYSLIKKGETEEEGLSISYPLSLFSGYNVSAERNAPHRRLDRLRAGGENYAQWGRAGRSSDDLTCGRPSPARRASQAHPGGPSDHPQALSCW